MLIRKIAFRVSAILLLVIIFDVAFGNILRHFYFTQSSGFQYRTTYAMEQTTAEVLVFGSSRANHHYVPDIFEKRLAHSFYNVGRDGQGILFHTAMLKAILKRYTPKVVILEYYGDFENLDGGYDKLASLLPYYHDHPEIRDIVNLKGGYERIKLLSSIYPYNSEALSIAVGNMQYNKQRTQDYQGYIPLYGIWPDEINSAKVYGDGRLDQNKVAAFKEFLTLAKAQGVKVIVVDSPIYAMQPYDAGMKLAQEICQAQSVPFLDFTQDPQFIEHRSLFKDISHLNNVGAEMFSQLIADYIRKNYVPFDASLAESHK